MPQDGIVVQVNIDHELLAIIRWLVQYKGAADEALTTLTSAEDYDDLDLPRTQGIALRALNIGAHPPIVWEEKRFVSGTENDK